MYAVISTPHDLLPGILHPRIRYGRLSAVPYGAEILSEHGDKNAARMACTRALARRGAGGIASHEIACAAKTPDRFDAAE